MKLKKMLVLAAAGIGMSLYAGQNPVLGMFPDDITFHLSYDSGSADADMASGSGKPVKEIVKAEFQPGGVFGGQALKQGCLYYASKDNFHPNESGTLIVWVSPQDWPEKAPDLTQKEPGFGVFGSGLVMGKMYNHKGGKSALHFTAQYSKRSRGVHLSEAGNVCQWKNRSWHLMVAVWDLSTIALSVDGRPLKVGQLKEKALNHSLFAVGSRDSCGYHIAIDEVTILNRKLTNEEIAALYTEAGKNIQK